MLFRKSVCYGKAHSKHTPITVPRGLQWCQETQKNLQAFFKIRWMFPHRHWSFPSFFLLELLNIQLLWPKFPALFTFRHQLYLENFNSESFHKIANSTEQELPCCIIVSILWERLQLVSQRPLGSHTLFYLSELNIVYRGWIQRLLLL